MVMDRVKRYRFHCYLYFQNLISLYLILNCHCQLRCVAQFLPPQEVEALEAIALKLKHKHWNVKRSSCNGGDGFGVGHVALDIPKKAQPLSNVTCDCSFTNNSLCHVTHIQLERLNLTGELPSEFSKLAFLQEMILVGLPSLENREMILTTLLAKEEVDEGLNLKELATLIEGYTGSDLKNLCTTAAYRPVRELILQERLKDLVFEDMKRNLCEPDEYTYTILVRMTGRSWKPDESLAIFHEMLSRGCSPNLIVYNTIIQVLSWSRMVDKTLFLFSKMMENDCRPNEFTFSLILNLLASEGQLVRLDEVVELSKKHMNKELSQNYISGTIPITFGQLPLKTLNLLDNRISGSIPREIANIDTLEELVLEDNQLGGTLPPELGGLKSLKRLLLSSNNFIGTIPESFGNLKNLTDFRIDGSGLSGKIPDLIGNWTNMAILNLQGTSMAGPIPSTISLLRNLQQLRISDLNGSGSSFPNLRDMTNMRYLILRNCLIKDSIPAYIADMRSLNTLDLSFNRLSGKIPDSVQPLESSLSFLYLNNNSLSGEIPSWISDSKKNFDVSYNNFTQTTSQYLCHASRVNLVASHSSSSSNLTSWCLKKDLPCPGTARYSSLFINCGGPKIELQGGEYEEDSVTEGASYFHPTDRWAYSSTGVFIYNDRSNFVASKTNVTGEEYFGTARLSPASLKYYGLCMQKGSYKVRLHFAEIQFSNDETFSSIGKRIFDVSIQGSVVWKDFNIAEKAGGFGKGTTLEQDVTVNGSTLEIHLYWAGKGTTAVPDRGVYGPLISAISITPNFKIKTGGLSSGSIVGIVVASLLSLALVLVVLWMKGCLGGKDVEDKELQGAIELQTGYFSLRHIKAATNNFDRANKIGEGGFGPVYKGILPDGLEIAVKQLSTKSKQGNREFINEIGLISALQHPNLVRLYGCCIEANQLLLIYEYLENNSLARALFGREEQLLNLDWRTRKKIFLGIARGLAYLHEESRLKIVHRDIKASNVLLDGDFNAKISDFGLAKLDEEENTHISTRVAGTLGYMAPEYAMRGYLTDKADVYSFGIVALEIVSGKSNTSYMPKEEFVSLLDWAYVLQEQGNLLEIVDPILRTNYSKEKAMSMLNIALLCANPSPTLRPSMSAVVSMFEGTKKIEAPGVKHTTADNFRFKAFAKLSQDSQSQSSMSSGESIGVRSTTSRDGPWVDSSVSRESKDTSRLITDIYDVNLD